MWLILVYSYLQLTVISINMLTCVSIHGKSGRVLGEDGSVDCFSTEHKPYYATALAIIILIIVPPPLILLYPKSRETRYLMHFVDRACCKYKDSRRWWAAITLLKRVVLALICSQVGEERTRLVAITIFLWFLILGYYFAW